MSGGVDSSVAALLCAREGLAMAAVTLRLADATDAAPGRCCAPRDVADARRVAASLGLPHYVLDLREQFERDVVAPLARAYVEGRTPVPCVPCNDSLKFGSLLGHARALGAEAVATGHYARRVEAQDGRFELRRAVDRSRDQTYFLHGITQAQLAAARFPLGDMPKPAVRALAREAGLLTADKPDSREICFIPDGDVGAFVERKAVELGLPVRPGAIVDREGRQVGDHAGVHRFTVGQRRGLGAHGAATYAVELRVATAEVVVGDASDLLAREAIVPEFRWVAGHAPAGPIEAMVQVRHGQREVVATLTPCAGGTVHARFAEPERAVSRGQYLVAYDGDTCLGGGAIGQAIA